MRSKQKLQRYLCAILAVFQIVPFFSGAVSIHATESDSFVGDVSQDGVVDSADLVILSSHIARIERITDEDALCAADLNQDGVITAADMTALAAILEQAEDDLSISQVSVDQSMGEAGSVFVWSAEAEGTVGTVEYAFELIDQSPDVLSGQADAVIARQDFSTSGQFRVRIMDIGAYALTVTCRDEQGRTYSLSGQAPVTVVAPELQIIQTACENAGTVFTQEPVTWSVHTIGGIKPYVFTYTLKLDGEQIVHTESSDSAFTYTAHLPGAYILEVSCTDREGTTVYADCDAVTVTSLPAGPAAPPVLKVLDPAYSLAESPGEAMLIPCEELHFFWKEVEHAASYEIIMEYADGAEWTELFCDNTSGLEYTVSPALISGWDTSNLFRLRVTAQGFASSDENIYYFQSFSGEEPILVDGLTSVKWKLTSSEPAERTFSVSALLPWTVSTDSDWITITQGEKEFHAQVSENSQSEREGWIAVTDGTAVVRIRVKQGVGNGAPVLVYPAYSEQAEAPTEIPTGEMILGFDAKDSNYVSIKLYEKSASGQLTEVYHAISPESEEYHPVITDYVFQSNTDYLVELSGCFEEEYESDAPRNYYYVRMTDLPHMLLIDGEPACTAREITDYAVTIYATGAWRYTTDADWLSPESYADISYKKDCQEVDIIMEPNETRSPRTGTITFICGSETATLTIRQDSCIPRFIKPSNMSQDQNNPTILPRKGFVDHTVYQTGSYARLINGTWSEETSWGVSTQIGEWTTLYPDDFFETDVLYRFTMQAGAHTAVYYAKFSDGVTEPYAVIHDGADDYIDLDLSFSSDAGKTTIDLSTSGRYSIKSDSAWLSVSSASGSAAVSEKEITINTTRNTTGISRTGTLTIYSENTACAKITVVQDGVDHLTVFVRDDDRDYVIYDPQTSFRNLDCDRHSVYFLVEASDSYTVSSSDSWITCKSKYITLEKNNTGSRRTGTVVISCGRASKTITVTQEAKMDAPTLVAPSLSTDDSAPSIMKNDDLNLSFNAVNGAVRYKIGVLPADSAVLLPYSKLLSFEQEIQADNSGTYSCTIPKSALSVNAESYDEIYIFAYDAYGYSSDQSYYLKTTNTSAALINGTTVPVWDNAADIAVSREFIVYSTGTWRAASQASWISLDKTSGSNGDVLKVTLKPNTGAARSGRVVITVGTTQTVLTVNQCAWLPEYPSITSPVFSEDPSSPTMIDAGTTSLHVTWNYEPQAEYYKVSIQSFKSNSVQHIEAKSPKLNTGEYTFENLILEQGQRYCVRISRASHWGHTAASYFFMLSDENAFVLVNESEAMDSELEGDEDFDIIPVTSSGVWTAVANDDWIMVDNERITQEDLDLQEETAGDHSRYSGLPGEDVYISVLRNPTGTFRHGSVTVRCGSAECTIFVIQEPCYTTAELYYPQLAGTRKESTPLPYGAVSLRWSSASGGTGEYSIILYQRDEDVEYRYHEIAQFDNIADTCYTIPRSLLTEGAYYKVWLGTCINGTEDAPGQWYYFRLGYRDELLVRATTDWDTIRTNGFVTVNARAQGGSGGYRFSYELLKNGRQVAITELDDWDSYTFNITQTGSYQVRVYVRDSAGQGANTLSNTCTVSEAALARLSLSQTQWEIGTAGGNTTVTVNAYNGWRIVSMPDWITGSVSEGTNGTAVTLTAAANPAGERSGYVAFSGSGKSAAIFVRQSGSQLPKPVVIQPTGNVSFAPQDLTVAWNAVSGAEYYILKIRDTTANVLAVYETDLTGTSVTIPSGCLISGHSYSVSVGAARAEDLPSSAAVSWAERTFTVSSDAENLCTVSGSVTDSLGNPLPGADIYVYDVDDSGDFRFLTQLESDSSGRWSISGLNRGRTFAFEAALSGYTFPAEAITVNGENSAYTGIDFRAENHRMPAAVSPGSLDFGSDAETDGFRITLEGSWRAKTDAAWIHLSRESGTGAADIEVRVDENSEDESRTGSITVTDQAGTAHTVEVFQEEPVTQIHVAYGAGTAITQVSTFDQDNHYTGAELRIGQPYEFGDGAQTFVIDQPLNIPNGVKLKINGNLVIEAEVSFAPDRCETYRYYGVEQKVMRYAELECTGDLTVKSDGILNMYEGGKITARGSFIFKPKEKHDLELAKGKILVGHDLIIKKNFYANGTNEVHLIASNGRRHVIDIDDKLFEKNDQHLNALILDDEDVMMLHIKDEFNCNTLTVANWNFLEKALFPASNTGKYGPFLIEPVNTAAFKALSPEKQRQVITNIHVGMMRLVADIGDTAKKIGKTELTIELESGAEKTYTYKDASGEIRAYTTIYTGASMGGFSVGFGSIHYEESSVYSGDFMVSASPHMIAAAVEEFRKEVLKAGMDEIDEIMKENLALYNAIIKDLLVDMFGDVVLKFEKTIKDAETIKNLIEKLCEEKSDLEKYNEIMKKIQTASS